MTDIKLELMCGINMFHFIEKGMRGGVSYIANRYGKANNKYMKDYNKKASSKYIMYLDAKHLYGWAMSQYLPTGVFRWKTNVDKIDVFKYKDDSKKGSILEVDLEYPQELHDFHNDYPLGPEQLNVSKSMLSECCRKIKDKYGILIGQVEKKLIPTLSNKTKYVLHYPPLYVQKFSTRILSLHKIKETLVLNRPAYVGMCILDLMKTLM